MRALEPVEHMQARYTAALAEIPTLEARQAAAEAAWQTAIADGDAKAEAVALKAMQAAQDATAAAKARLPILQDAIARARRQCLPNCAAEVAGELQRINEAAEPLARILMGGYETARAAAGQLNGLFKDHQEHIREYTEIAQQAGGVDTRGGGWAVPLPHDARFAVAMSHLNSVFRPDFDERFRLSESKLLGRKPAQAEPVTGDGAEEQVANG